MKYISITILIVLFFSCEQKPQIIELPKLSGCIDHKYRCVVLIQNPPENIDSLKALMVRYFVKEEKMLKVANPQNSLWCIEFHRKTWDTSYFIDNAESSGGFASYRIDDYSDLLGNVIKNAHYYKNDSSRTVDAITMYKKHKYCSGVMEISYEVLFDSAYPTINNWHKYE